MLNVILVIFTTKDQTDPDLKAWRNRWALCQSRINARWLNVILNCASKHLLGHHLT